MVIRMVTDASPFFSSFTFFKKKDTRKLVLLLIAKIFCFEVNDAVEQFGYIL